VVLPPVPEEAEVRDVVEDSELQRSGGGVTMRVMVVLLAIVTSVPVWAQPAGNSWWGFGQGMPNSLGLTPDQMTQIQDIANKWQEELLPLWADLQMKNLELDRLMWTPDPNPVEVEAKSKEIGNLQAEVHKKTAERQKAVRGVLTGQQKDLCDQQGLATGWGRGPGGYGVGRGNGGRGVGYGRGRGGWGGRFGGAGAVNGIQDGPGAASWGFYGRGPCGMGRGNGRSPMGNGLGWRRW